MLIPASIVNARSPGARSLTLPQVAAPTTVTTTIGASRIRNGSPRRRSRGIPAMVTASRA